MMSTSVEASRNGVTSENNPLKKSSRIRVSGAPGQEDNELLKQLFQKFGEVVEIQNHKYEKDVLVVSMASVDDANSACDSLNGIVFNNGQLTLNNISAANNKRRSNSNPNRQYLPHCPVRMLVNGDLVGAIIGKGGEMIKEITNKSKARIDIRRQSVQRTPYRKQNIMNDSEDSHHLSDRMQIVVIHGSPDSCSDAVREILTVCINEAKEKGKEEPHLSILAEDRFCGRIIGKDGKHLSEVREKSNTSVNLSGSPTITNSGDGQGFSQDRIVSIKGSLDGLCEAEKLISSKLRQCYQQEYPQPYSYGGGGHMSGGGGGGGNSSSMPPGWPYVTFTDYQPGYNRQGGYGRLSGRGGGGPRPLHVRY